jgi:hypothetical protein
MIQHDSSPSCQCRKNQPEHSGNTLGVTGAQRPAQTLHRDVRNRLIRIGAGFTDLAQQIENVRKTRLLALTDRSDW